MTLNIFLPRGELKAFWQASPLIEGLVTKCDFTILQPLCTLYPQFAMKRVRLFVKDNTWKEELSFKSFQSHNKNRPG